MPRDAFEWREFAKEVATEGITIESAEKIVERIRRQLRNPKQGDLLSFFGPDKPKKPKNKNNR